MQHWFFVGILAPGQATQTLLILISFVPHDWHVGLIILFSDAQQILVFSIRYAVGFMQVVHTLFRLISFERHD